MIQGGKIRFFSLWKRGMKGALTVFQSGKLLPVIYFTICFPNAYASAIAVGCCRISPLASTFL